MAVLEDRRTGELESFFLSRHEIPNSPRVLLIVAHPDDETVGAGVLLSRRKNIQVVHVTDGSPLNPADAIAAGFSNRQDYSEARTRETVEALAIAGVSEKAILSLPFSDQQLSFHLRELSTAILQLISQSKPEIVLTHAYEGGHPDHDSAAFACHVAHRASGLQDSISLCEFAEYHAGNGGMEVYQFLPGREREYTYELTPSEKELKVRMIHAFLSQEKTLQPFSAPVAERFRVAPAYDFRRPPHEGRLWYENFGWGTDGATWRKMASQTLSEILHP